MGTLTTELFRDRVSGRAATATAALRVPAGLVFVFFGALKFPFGQLELAEFVRYGFPDSLLIVWLVGAVEVVAGIALVLGLGTRPAAAALAVVMAGAVLTAGVRVGGPFHLGLAPTLLLIMLYLGWAGPGALALDHRLGARAASR
jgi:uncharacterized membrane protein YphA (DoxX/SURF4 family)